MIVAIAGRRIDAPDAEQARFPASMADSVKNRLSTIFKSVRATHIVSSGACGTDLLAIEAAMELNIKVTMILPFDAATFRSTSVTDRKGNWGEMYDGIIDQLRITQDLVELSLDKDDPQSYERTNLLILDQAQQKAELASPEPGQVLAVIVWEGKPKDSGDTTFHFMQEAERRKFLIRQLTIAE